MKPTAYYAGVPALGLTGKKKGLPLATTFVMNLQAGAAYRALEIPDERRGGLRVVTLNALPFPSVRGGTHALGTRGDTRLTGLFPLGADWEGCFVGGYPKDGEAKDRDAFLVKWSSACLKVWVFRDVGHDKAVLVEDWKAGNLDGVETPK